MRFEEALVAMREGKEVRRTLWDKSEGGVVLVDGQIRFTGTCCTYLFGTEDILAEDWVVIKPKNQGAANQKIAEQTAEIDKLLEILERCRRVVDKYTSYETMCKLKNDINAALARRGTHEPYTTD